jgi:sporulation protein YlmC with PRC-barrel domain
MIRQYSKIIGTHVLSHAEGDMLAMVEDLIVHPDTGKVEGFWVKPKTLPLSHAVLPMEGVVAWKRSLYVKDDQSLSEPEEVIRIADILSRKAYFVGNKVKTESGTPLGKVFDLDFDDRKMFLRYLFVRKSLSLFRPAVRFVPYDSIIQVLPEVIVVKDEEEKTVKEAGLVEDRQPALGA